KQAGVIAHGRFDPLTIPLETGFPIGAIEVGLSDVTPAQKYSLVVGLEGLPFENDWDVWVFPERLESSAPDGIRIVETLDEPAIASLNRGEKVLLLLGAEQIKSDVALGFSTIFWNTAFTKKQPPHTLGILCDPVHPVFRDFPTEYHSNWQ